MIERGSLVLVTGKGDYGKPRPALVVQNAQIIEQIESITVCFLTSDLTNESLLRISIEPSETNGLRVKSQIQVEKIMTFPADKVHGPIGRLEPDLLNAVDTGLLFHLDLLTPVRLSAIR